MNITIKIDNDDIKDVIDYTSEVLADRVRDILSEGIRIFPPTDAGISGDSEPADEDRAEDDDPVAHGLAQPEEEQEAPPSPFDFDSVADYNRSLIQYAIYEEMRVRFFYVKPAHSSLDFTAQRGWRVVQPERLGDTLMGGEDYEGYKSFRLDRIQGYVSLVD